MRDAVRAKATYSSTTKQIEEGIQESPEPPVSPKEVSPPSQEVVTTDQGITNGNSEAPNGLPTTV